MASESMPTVRSQLIQQIKRKRPMLHAIPRSTAGVWTYQDIDQDAVSVADLKWLAEAELISVHDRRNESQGHLWQTRPTLDDLQDRYPPLTCNGGNGVLDCGGSRFRNKGDVLECKSCGGNTPKERARGRMR